jgi:NAD(P)H-dependent FMN reductase
MSDKPRLLIIVGSTRPGRVSLPVAEYVAAQARAHGAFDVHIADLAEPALPFLDERAHPRLGQYEHDHTKRWSATVAAADAFMFVTPEYNHGFSAPLKNALDMLSAEWRGKPGAIVSYGGVSAGLRAVAMLKLVLSALGVHTVAAAMPIPWVGQKVEGGVFQGDDTSERAVKAMCDDLNKWHGILRPHRA